MTRPPHPDRPLLFLDYDGTLAPIVDDPAAARPHPAIPALLARLHARYPVVVVTGRHLDDLTGFFAPAPSPIRAVGLHGTQEGRLGETPRHTLSDEAAAALAALREKVPALDGLHVEDKGPAFAVHYRAVVDEAAALHRLRAWADGVPDALEPVWGKKVVELRPVGTSKGVAVRRIAAEHPDRTPVYLGDDVTDEDAFAVLDAPAVTVKVGEGETAARYRLPDVDAVVDYLRGFLDG
ncbi:MAG: trehalose-phosphatase [Rhodothermales bacterium]